MTPKIEIVRTHPKAYDVYVEGVKQKRVRDVEVWFDQDNRCLLCRIETDVGEDQSYAQVYRDFELVYSPKTTDDRMREAWGHECPISDTTRTLIDQLAARDAKGRQKYGTSLDRTDLSLVDWLQHQSEELMDGAGYALAAKREAERLLRIEKWAYEVVEQLQGVQVGLEVLAVLRQLNNALLRR